MPIWLTGTPPPSPSRAANGGGKRPTAGCPRSQSLYVHTIFAPHRLPSRARVASAHREWAAGFALAVELGPWAAARAGQGAGLCNRTNRLPLPCRGEKPRVSGRPPARFQKIRAEFRELLSDWACTPPAGFRLVSKKHRQTRAFQDNVQKGRKGILLHLRQRSLMRPQPLPVQNPPGDRRRQKIVAVLHGLVA